MEDGPVCVRLADVHAVQGEAVDVDVEERDTEAAAAASHVSPWPQNQYPHYFPQGYTPPKPPPGSRPPGGW
ncbi:MAG: hypothetical protein HY744_34200 [Deltaproteobacteria bacterium]|nr:hypothetical protein [Deltaproteobacteria bacterium]